MHQNNTSVSTEGGTFILLSSFSFSSFADNLGHLSDKYTKNVAIMDIKEQGG